MRRSLAREMAMKMLYAYSVGGADTPKDALDQTEMDVKALSQDEQSFATGLYEGVLAHLEEIDAKISAHAENWNFDRIGKVDLSVLRLAVYEMTYSDPEDVSTGTAINEAVELAKRFGGEHSYSFINGILGSISRETA